MGYYTVPVANPTNSDIWIPAKTGLVVISECAIEPRPTSEVEFIHTDDREQTIVPKDDVASVNGEAPIDVASLIPHNLECTRTQRRKIVDLFTRYSDIFIQHDLHMGYTTTVTHKINTSDCKPVAEPYRRLPPNQYQKIKDHIQSLYKKIITKSTSPYASPIVVVRKKDGFVRLCVDYRKLNKKTVRDAFPPPKMEESLDALHGSTVFSTCDLVSGFQQIAMSPENQHKTAFVTPFELFEYTRMPFGLCNSPATFQRLMQHVFNELVFQILLVYLDDIVVYSRTNDDQVERLDTVFRKLKKHGLKLNPSKCNFFQPEVVQEWQKPKSFRDLRSFIGFASYYRRFVHRFAQIAKPLYNLIALCNGSQKNTKPTTNTVVLDHWNHQCDKAFAEIKRALTASPFLSLDMPTFPVHLSLRPMQSL